MNLIWLSILALASAEAFLPKQYTNGVTSARSSTASTIQDVPTTPIPGMKPGTSGLRKKVEVWQETPNYVENFIQSLLDTEMERRGGSVPETLLIAGDGRYYNLQAMQIICRVLAGNQVSQVLVPQFGIMSTPAASAAIRRSACGGAILLTASHNPGGPGQDFGIKYNLEYGQPAGEDFTDRLYEKSLNIQSYKTVEPLEAVDFDAPPGTTFQLTDSCTVTIIDPFTEYTEILKECFDFPKLKEFCSKSGFSMIFDGMHGAGGPFARRVLVEELGLPEVRFSFQCRVTAVLKECKILAHPCVARKILELFDAVRSTSRLWQRTSRSQLDLRGRSSKEDGALVGR